MILALGSKRGILAVAQRAREPGHVERVATWGSGPSAETKVLGRRGQELSRVQSVSDLPAGPFERDGNRSAVSVACVDMGEDLW